MSEYVETEAAEVLREAIETEVISHGDARYDGDLEVIARVWGELDAALDAYARQVAEDAEQTTLRDQPCLRLPYPRSENNPAWDCETLAANYKIHVREIHGGLCPPCVARARGREEASAPIDVTRGCTS